MEWQDRIIKLDRKPANQFLANPNNARKHPKSQQDALKGSLDYSGWLLPVLENKRTGNLIDGHERVWQAFHKDEETLVPYILVDIPIEEEAAAVLTLDYIASLAITDAEAVQNLIDLVNTDNEAMLQTIDDLAKEVGIEPEQPDAPEPQIDKAEELREKWGVELGQLWEIGSHRIICGDCTDSAVVERLMGGDKADSTVTDPPWNVGWKYDGYDDNLSPAEYKIFSDKWRTLAENHGSKLFFVALSMKEYINFHLWFPMAERMLAECQNFVQHTGGFMQHAFNPILIWGKPKIDKSVAGKRDYFIAETSNTRMTEDKRISKINTATRWPPTVEYLVSFTNEESVVYDPFLGSGTTLVACQNLGRKGRGIEISPAYTAVSLQRLSDMGLEPCLID